MHSIEQAREALKRIADQKKTDELDTEYDVETASFEDGYDMIIDVARRALASLPSTPVDGVGAEPRVKPLEWTEVTSARSDEDPTPEHTGDYEAATPFGTYYIEQYFGSDSYGWNVTINGYDPVADKDDPEDAKAAAQTDYERRILSALANPEAEARLRERVDEDDTEMTWRDLALQFDGQRMQAMQILRAIRDGHDMKDMVAEFVAAPPLSGEEVLAARIARLAQAEGGPAVTEARNPDYIYDPQEWEYTCDWDDRYLLTDDLTFGQILEVNTLFVGASKFAARVPISFDEDGDVEDDEVQWFDSRGEAEAALHPQSAAGEEGK